MRRIASFIPMVDGQHGGLTPETMVKRGSMLTGTPSSEPAQGPFDLDRDIDWAEDLVKSGLFTVDKPKVFPWMREIGIELWLTDHRSQSNIASLERVQRRRLLSQVRGLLLEQFPDSVARVRYETRLWIAHPLT